jgi:hypothetical protein
VPGCTPPIVNRAAPQRPRFAGPGWYKAQFPGRDVIRADDPLAIRRDIESRAVPQPDRRRSVRGPQICPPNESAALEHLIEDERPPIRREARRRGPIQPRVVAFDGVERHPAARFDSESALRDEHATIA